MSLSLRNKRKQRFFYYLYSYQHELLLEVSSKLGISASDILGQIIECGLPEIKKQIKNKEVKFEHFLTSQ